MSRTIEFTGEQINELITNKELWLGLASRTVYVFDENGKQEVVMNYEGDGYRPVKVTIEFEYDETISFTEDED